MVLTGNDGSHPILLDPAGNPPSTEAPIKNLEARNRTHLAPEPIVFGKHWLGPWTQSQLGQQNVP
jgi:hypothetical protein